VALVVITHQLHEEVPKRWFWSCERGVPKLHPHLHYSFMELAAQEFWSWGVWLEFLLELLEFWSRVMPNRP